MGQRGIPFLGSVLGSGPKDPALSALIPPRPLAPSEPPAVLLDACGCAAAATLAAGEGGGGLSEAPAEGSTGIAVAAAPPAAAAAAPAAGPAPASVHSLSQELQAGLSHDAAN